MYRYRMMFGNVVSFTLASLAAMGWLLTFVMVVAMITGTFDELLMFMWEVTE